MPRSRRRHHSHSRSRSRSHSYDREREPKRRKIEGYDSPRHRRSLSTEDNPLATETTSLKSETENFDSTIDVSLNLKLSDTEEDKGDLSQQEDVETSKTQSQEKLNFSNLFKDTDDETNNENENKTMENNDSGDEDESIRQSVLSGIDMEALKAKIRENILKTSTNKSMSPKNLQRRVESEVRKEQKRLEREEKDKRRQLLKEEKEKQRLEKEEQRKKELEAKQKEKEMKEEKKKKEREEKEKKRKEKEEMEEQKKKEREQEKLKKQQEIDEKNKEKQKLEERKQKTAAVFASFFTKKMESIDDTKKNKEDLNDSIFKPFEVKSDMRLAPLLRAELNQNKKQELVNHIESQSVNSLYLEELKNGKPIGRSSRTWIFDDTDTSYDDDVVILDEAPLGESIIQGDTSTATKMKAKFLKFHDNRRPAYFGTWRKKSEFVKPKKPLAQDKKHFDYEFDSDDDWEDEGDAGEVESLKGSDEEEKEVSDNEYEVDNEFFVPHGHLSDDEVNDEEDKPLSPQTHKAHLKLLNNEFEEERKAKTMRIKPRIIGCIWQNKVKDNVDEAIQKFLEPFSIISLGVVKITPRSMINQSPVKKKGIPSKLLEKEYIPDFLTLIHGNVKKRKFLVNEFLEFLKTKGVDVAVSKVSLAREMKRLADWVKCPEKGPMSNKFCWFVPESIRKEYQVDLTLPNNWNYVLKNSRD